MGVTGRGLPAFLLLEFVCLLAVPRSQAATDAAHPSGPAFVI